MTRVRRILTSLLVAFGMVVGFGQLSAAPAVSAPEVKLSSGGLFACQIKADSTLWCFGLQGADDQDTSVGSSRGWNVPVQHPGSYKTVSVGYGHACAIKTDNSLWCWGLDNFGQVDGKQLNFPNVYSPAVEPTPGDTYTSVAAGWDHTCAVRTDGQIRCWGYGNSGNIAPNPPNQWIGGSDWASVSSKLNRVCGQKTDGTLWCWGGNMLAGSNATPKGGQPKVAYEVNPGVAYTSYTVGMSNLCALDATGALSCWYFDQGAAGTVAGPMPVNAGSTFSSVTGAIFNTCALKADGSNWCFNGPNNGVITASQYAAGSTWNSLALGYDGFGFNCGVQTSGDTGCLGIFGIPFTVDWSKGITRA